MSSFKIINSFFEHLLNFAFPRICVACEKQRVSNESAICLECLWNLPRIDEAYKEKMESKFWGKVEVGSVNAFVHFNKKGKIQKVLHALKYRNFPELGAFLGRVYATELKNLEIMREMDLIIPIPLHKSKEKQRGYNQAEMFANGLAEGLEIPVRCDLLERMRKTSTQTKTKTRFDRFKNLQDAFSLTKGHEFLRNKNVMLVDDILTTGATLESAGKVLLEAHIKSLNIVTIASA